MSLRVDFLAGADADMQEVFNRLEDDQEGRGTAFLARVDAYVTRISTFPKLAPAYDGSVRRQVMYKEPYGIFYEPQPTRILVVAILDLRQDKDQILKRLRR